MAAPPQQLVETVIVRVSVLGSSGEGIGTHDVRIDFDKDSDADIGRKMQQAFREALTPAIVSFGPELANKWIDQAKRDGDPGV